MHSALFRSLEELKRSCFLCVANAYHFNRPTASEKADPVSVKLLLVLHLSSLENVKTGPMAGEICDMPTSTISTYNTGRPMIGNGGQIRYVLSS